MRSLLVVLAIGCASPQPPPPAPPSPKPTPIVEPSDPIGLPAGYVEMKPERVVSLGEADALLLVDEPDNLVLPIFIGGTEGQSIDTRMRGVAPPRPLTHDLLDHVLQKLHAQLVQVQIDELRRSGDEGGVYIGSIFLRVNGRVTRLDARPSDAIALAIGDKVAIYVARKVLDEAGMKWDEVKQQLQSSPVTGSPG